MVIPIIKAFKNLFPLTANKTWHTIAKTLVDVDVSDIIKESARFRKNLKRSYKTLKKHGLEYQVESKYSNIEKHLKAPNLRGLKGDVKRKAALDELQKLWDFKNNKTLNYADVRKSIMKQITSGVTDKDKALIQKLPLSKQIELDKKVKDAYSKLNNNSNYERGSLEGEYTVATSVWNLSQNSDNEFSIDELLSEMSDVGFNSPENNFINQLDGDEFADF